VFLAQVDRLGLAIPQYTIHLFCVGEKIGEDTRMTFAAPVGKGLLFLAMLSWTKQVGGHVGLSKHRRFVDIRNIRNDSSSSEFGIGHSDHDNKDDVQERYLTQRLNHFAPSQGRTYQQRYFYSDRHVDHNNQTHQQQYAFLCVGGEGPPLTSNVLVDSLHCTGDMLAVASQLHIQHGLSIHLFALEHRYYGSSYPSKLLLTVRCMPVPLQT
jgi:Serine carboxypeptidase S28